MGNNESKIDPNITMKILVQIRNMVKYIYMTVVGLMVIIVARENLHLLGDWEGVFYKLIVSVEIVGVIVFLGLKVAMKLFENIEGDVLGTQAHYIVTFWESVEKVVIELLMYNGIIGIMMLMVK